MCVRKMAWGICGQRPYYKADVVRLLTVMCKKKMDNETWLIEIGDEIIEKKSNSNYEDLSELEKSVYCFWVIDYAVRNSGTLGPFADLYQIGRAHV